MFWELYKYLMKIPYPNIQMFLSKEFPKFRRKYREEQKEQRRKNEHHNNSQNKLI
jgi:hypothetical protein